MTSREAARLLGVSDASIKRWADNGLLPMTKTAGGHRRFRPQDIAVFRHEGSHEIGPIRTQQSPRAPEAQAKPRGISKSNDLSQSLYDSLMSGHADETSALLIRLFLDGISVATMADEVLCPAMRRVGDKWHSGQLSVAEEHVATRTALEALMRLRSAARPVSLGPRAICCATEEDFHELPVQIASLTLETTGWDVINLGATTPFYSLAETIERFSPRLVCVTSTILDVMDRGVREFADVRRVADRKGAAIVIGGAGFKEVASRYAVNLYADNFRELDDFAASLMKDEARIKNLRN